MRSAVLAALLLVSTAPIADQSDPQLDGFFERLRQTEADMVVVLSSSGTPMQPGTSARANRQQVGRARTRSA